MKPLTVNYKNLPYKESGNPYIWKTQQNGLTLYQPLMRISARLIYSPDSITTTTMNKVLIDLYKLKYPNTGLYIFSLELARALSKVKDEYGVEPTYLVTKECSHLVSGGNIQIFKWINRYCFRKKADIKVTHAPFQSGKIFPKNSKIVLTIHDLNFLYDRKHETKSLMKEIQKNIDRSDYIVAISEFTKQDVCKHFDLKGKPFEVIYNGCNFYNGTQIDSPVRHKPNAPFLFSIGTVLRKKNFHVLPSLLQNNDMELIIAGNPSSYSDVIMEEARKYGVESRVHIIGAIDEADKDWYYRNCEAFLFPSVAEGFGLPALEALSYGKPTFLSQYTSLPEIGGDYAFYFDIDFTPEKMRKVFEQGVKDFKNRDVKAQVDYSHSYSWDNTAREYCKIYNELAYKD